MFDPERLLGQMLSGALGQALGGKTSSRRRRHDSGFGGGSLGAKAQLGLGRGHAGPTAASFASLVDRSLIGGAL